VSPLTQAMIINGAVLIATLECDLGPHRKIGAFRILRTPVVLAAVIPLFLARPVTHGNGRPSLDPQPSTCGPWRFLTGLSARLSHRSVVFPSAGRPAHPGAGWEAVEVLASGEQNVTSG
jgi:hypothetical protein